MSTSSQPKRPPKPSEQTWEADAILVERLHGLGDDGPENYAKNRLHKACDDIILDEIGDKFVYGNRNGFLILEELADIPREMKILEAKHKQKIEILEKEAIRLRLDVEGRWLQEEALTIRRRFIDHFKRDVMKIPGYQPTDAIKAGNITAYHGNALSDAYLFKHDNRKDVSIYTRLYGFQFEQVLNYADNGIDGGIFSVLNAYATLLMQSPERKEISSELERAFRNFVYRAEEYYPLTPMDDGNGKLAMAYWEFWRLHKQRKN